MKKSGSYFLFAFILFLLSVLVYGLHYIIFGDWHHIFIYLLGDIAFVFIEVLLVSLIIHRVLELREKSARMKKLNMVIGTFFSECGTELLRFLYSCDAYPLADINSSVPAEELYKRLDNDLSRHQYQLQKHINWEQLKTFLLARRRFMLRMLENPNLLEHENFTNLLWAVFHLTEELEARENLTDLPHPDIEHLANDLKRVYRRLAAQWLQYIKHLYQSYPYLFSLAMRMHPFKEKAAPVIESS